MEEERKAKYDVRKSRNKLRRIRKYARKIQRRFKRRLVRRFESKRYFVLRRLIQAKKKYRASKRNYKKNKNMVNRIILRKTRKEFLKQRKVWRYYFTRRAFKKKLPKNHKKLIQLSKLSYIDTKKRLEIIKKLHKENPTVKTHQELLKAERYYAESKRKYFKLTKCSKNVPSIVKLFAQKMVS